MNFCNYTVRIKLNVWIQLVHYVLWSSMTDSIVNAIQMLFQMAFLTEMHGTDFTTKWFYSAVNVHVPFQMAFPHKRILLANIAFESRRFAHFDMSFFFALLWESFKATWTMNRKFLGMNSCVPLKASQLCERFVATFASKWLFAGVCSFVHFNVCGFVARIITESALMHLPPFLLHSLLIVCCLFGQDIMERTGIDIVWCSLLVFVGTFNIFCIWRIGGSFVHWCLSFR